MPRKPKSVYTRIEEKTAQINKLKEKISICETELIALNKERERVEMEQIFSAAKEKNLNFQEVLDLISRSNKKIK